MQQTPCIELAGDLVAALNPVIFAERKLTKELPSLDAWQKEACRADGHGLLLLCGRQTGKSTFAALIAVHQVVAWPGTLVLLISPTLRQSSELFRKAMVLLDSLDDAPKAISRSKTELKLKNRSSLISLPGANPDAIRGYSAPGLIIEDEAAFVNDKTFVASRPMLATSDQGRHILLTTPYGRRGHFHDLWTSDDPAWSRITIKSEECSRISSTFLDTERRALSDRAFRQEYQCEFLEAASAVFPADLIERLTEGEKRRMIMPNEAAEMVKEITEDAIGAEPGSPEMKALQDLTEGAVELMRPAGRSKGTSQLDDIFDAERIDKRREEERQRQAEEDKRAAEVKEMLTEYCSINHEINAILKDPGPDLEKANDRLAELDAQEAELRAKEGFPADKVAPPSKEPRRALTEMEKGLRKIMVQDERFASV